MDLTQQFLAKSASLGFATQQVKKVDPKLSLFTGKTSSILQVREWNNRDS